MSLLCCRRWRDMLTDHTLTSREWILSILGHTFIFIIFWQLLINRAQHLSQPGYVGNTNNVKLWIYVILNSLFSFTFDVLKVQDVDEAMKLSNKGVAMPFFVNNVDVTVATNTINGLTSGLLSGIFTTSDFDADLQHIYQDSADLIIYEITRNFSSRRDLALTYYPSKFECFWFTSRTLTILRNFYQKAPLPLKVSNILSIFWYGLFFDDFISRVKCMYMQ